MENEKKISTEETEKNKEQLKPKDKLDALIFNDESVTSDYSYSEVELEFESFIAEYRELISKTRAEAASIDKDTEGATTEPTEKPLPSSEQSNVKEEATGKKEPSDWSEDITLTPGEYEELPSNEDELIAEEPPEQIPEEEDDTPDFDLGDEGEVDDLFQISINFDGEEKPEHHQDEEKVSVYDPEKPRLIDWVFDIAEMFVFVLAAVMILTTFVFRHAVVEGPSMNTTLQDGDHLIISKLFYEPERYDIIVFEDYSTSLEKAVVKRVIGLPGETVEIRKSADGTRLIILIDGKEIDDEYAYYDMHGELSVCAPVTLGENELFVLGDNRQNSTDSRASSVGPIEKDAVLGKVLFRFFPFDKFSTLD